MQPRVCSLFFNIRNHRMAQQCSALSFPMGKSRMTQPTSCCLRSRLYLHSILCAATLAGAAMYAVFTANVREAGSSRTCKGPYSCRVQSSLCHYQGGVSYAPYSLMSEWIWVLFKADIITVTGWSSGQQCGKTGDRHKTLYRSLCVVSIHCCLGS